jgi:hypothetical protein
MVKNFTGRKTNFMPFKRSKPGAVLEHHTLFGRRGSASRRLTQFSFGACSSGTLVKFSDPT